MSESFAYYRKQLKHKQLTRDEEKELLTKYKTTGCKQSREKLIQHNLRFVVYMCKQYRSFKIDFMDVISCGNIGLIKSIEKYDMQYVDTVSLATYAAPWIQQEVNKLITNDTIIKIPVTKGIQKFRKMISKIQTDFSSENIHEMAKECGVDKFDANMLYNAVYNVSDFHNHYDDILVEEYDFTLDSYQEHIKEILTYINTHFNDRWKDIILSRHLTESPQTYKQLGEKYGCSGSRIEQIEKKAFRQMKNELTNLKDVLL
jgi:RNA polymerase sigma factor (sigma-70 family)